MVTQCSMAGLQEHVGRLWTAFRPSVAPSCKACWIDAGTALKSRLFPGSRPIRFIRATCGAKKCTLRTVPVMTPRGYKSH